MSIQDKIAADQAAVEAAQAQLVAAQNQLASDQAELSSVAPHLAALDAIAAFSVNLSGDVLVAFEAAIANAKVLF